MKTTTLFVACLLMSFIAKSQCSIEVQSIIHDASDGTFEITFETTNVFLSPLGIPDGNGIITYSTPSLNTFYVPTAVDASLNWCTGTQHDVVFENIVTNQDFSAEIDGDCSGSTGEVCFVHPYLTPNQVDFEISSTSSSGNQCLSSIPVGTQSISMDPIIAGDGVEYHNVNLTTTIENIDITYGLIGNDLIFYINGVELDANSGFTFDAISYPSCVTAGSWTLDDYTCQGCFSIVLEDLSTSCEYVVSSYIGLNINCPTDLNNDGVTDTGDLVILLADFSSSAEESDFTCDGVVNSGDLVILLQSYAVNC